MLSKIIQGIAGGAAGGILGGANEIIKTVAGDKAAAEEFLHEEYQTLQQGYQAEFTASRANRTKWDSFVDGLNRLPRPMMTFGCIGLFVWAAVDPPNFTASMVGLQAVPEVMWWILWTIVAFWFGSRILQNAPVKFTPVDAERLKQIQQAQRNAQVEANYDRVLQDTSKPLPNWAILKWNREKRASRPD